MAHILEFAALGLQAQAGCPVTFSRTARTVEEGTYQVVVEYSEEKSADWRSSSRRRSARPRSTTRRSIFGALHRLRELDEDSTPSVRRYGVDRLRRCGARHPLPAADQGGLVQVRLGPASSGVSRLPKPT